jgi:hypothetical protein
VFTARYALSPYIKQIRFVFKGLMFHTGSATERKVTGKHSDNFFWRAHKQEIALFSFMSVCLSVRLSACLSTAPNERIFMTFDIGEFYENVKEVQI